MTSRNFQRSMVNQDQEIIFEVVKVSGEWVFPSASFIVEATRGKNMYLRLTDDGRSDIFRLDSVKDGENAGETVFGFVGNGGMDLVELTATTDGTGATTGSWDYEPGEGPAGEITVFQGIAAPGGTTYPDEAKVRAAVDAGKYVIIRIGGIGGYIYYGIGYQYGNQYMFPNLLTHGSELRLQPNQQGTEYEWSIFSEPVHNSVVTFNGTLDPDASPVDYSGMPDSIDVESAIANGNEVRLELTSSSGYAVIYRLINGMQYIKIFAAMDGEHIGKSGYVNLIIMSYAGPGNPWHWSVAKALQQALNTQEKTESDISSGHMEIDSNNTVTTLTLTTVNAVTMHTSDYSLPPNFAVQIDNTGNSNDVTIDVQHGPDILKYSVAGGNTVGAGKYMQLTCVGSCWTLAEFTVPTP